MPFMAPRERLVVVGSVVLAVAVGVVVVLAIRNPDPYADLRQASAQAIPGSLGYELQPPPSDARPTLTPSQVEHRYPAGGGQVRIAFASIRDTLEDRTIGPGWVLFARGVCLRNAKGELVSAARGGNGPEKLACTDDTIWILAVDPRKGTPLVALTGYDRSGTFGPDLAG
jgi:hypothetical protein